MLRCGSNFLTVGTFITGKTPAEDRSQQDRQSGAGDGTDDGADDGTDSSAVTDA